MAFQGSRAVNAPKSSNKWTYFALAMIAGALFLTRGGLASVAPLLRFALPVVIVVVALRAVKGRLTAAVDEAVRRSGGGRGRGPGQAPADEGQVIDLCPKCGAYMKAGHRCS